MSGAISGEKRREVAAKLREAVQFDIDAGGIAYPDDVYEAVGIDQDCGWFHKADVDRFADLVDRPTCYMVDDGCFMPRHEFRRMVCSECGGLHWEQTNPRLPRMRHCPWCGCGVIE